jgi:hypothetical protein
MQPLLDGHPKNSLSMAERDQVIAGVDQSRDSIRDQIGRPSA